MTQVLTVLVKNVGLFRSPDFAQMQLRKIGTNRMAKQAGLPGSGYARVAITEGLCDIMYLSISIYRSLTFQSYAKNRPI